MNKNPYDSLAVFVIDMQEHFLAALEKVATEMLIAHQCRVLRICRHLDIPVWTIEMKGHEQTVPAIREVTAYIPRVKTHIKLRANAFAEPSGIAFAEELYEFGIRTIFHMGIFANACVVGTAIGAHRNSFQVATHRSVLGDDPAQEIDVALATMSSLLDCKTMAFEDLLKTIAPKKRVERIQVQYA